VQLRELVVRGRLAPGTRIIESDVAVRLNASRTPVRSALQRLRQEGYVRGDSSGKQLRLTVSPLTREDARELFGILAELEGLGARWAAEQDEARRRRLAAELSELNSTLAAGARQVPTDPNRVFDLHTQFHRHLMEAVDAPRLRDLHRAIKPQADRYRRIYSSTFAQDSQTSVNEHEEIILCIVAGDADAAQYAVQTNWRNAAERLARVIEQVGERGSW
jgi:DNA-binding GntR family transcriptional regulator